MKNDQVFVDEIWKKYDNYKNTKHKEKFFKKHQYKHTEIKRKLVAITSSILGIIATTGVVYASVAIHNVLFTQKYTRTDFTKNPGYEYYQDMQMSDNIYYKRIYNYEEYKLATQRWDNLVEMSEADFQESFMIIIAGQNYDTTSLYISDIYIEDNKTCVELRKKDKWTSGSTVISAKVSRELDREEIKIKNLPNEVSTTGKYKDLDEITLDYTKEQALEDGCFVVEQYGDIISENKNQLDEFIEKKENGVIRIYGYKSGVFRITDVEYDNGLINIKACTFNLRENKINKPLYFTGNKIEKESFDEYIEYVCSNEIGDVFVICKFKNN